ncbi:hypothetical protein [Paracidovorax anthurii]|uniref:hypothetical protein n=1 Tax=Paracidovorax anthurii TaxID=78229 RepID=UPI0011BD64D2|nr:hypothetical protein [Paracidovorax anthurii]
MKALICVREFPWKQLLQVTSTRTFRTMPAAPHSTVARKMLRTASAKQREGEIALNDDLKEVCCLCTQRIYAAHDPGRQEKFSRSAGIMADIVGSVASGRRAS